MVVCSYRMVSREVFPKFVKIKTIKFGVPNIELLHVIRASYGHACNLRISKESSRVIYIYKA